MKIFIVGPFPEPIHGMSLANKNIFNHLNLKYDVLKHNSSINHNIKKKSDQGRFQVVYFLKAIVDFFFMCWKLISKRYDVLYITPGQSVLGFLRFLPVVLISKMKKVPVIQHFHGSRFVHNVKKTNWLSRKIIINTLHFTDQFIVLSDSLKVNFGEIIPIEKLTVCYNGVNIPQDLENVVKKKISVIFMSNLMVDKGVLELFKAIHVVRKYGNELFEFHFAGEIEAGIRKECLSFFNEHDDCCTYHGIVTGEKKHSILEHADILVLPSYDEGVPLAILEAYAYGCAVITTDVGGIPDIFKDGLNGKSVPVGDHKAINDSLINIMHDLDSIKLENRRLARQKYALDTFCENIESLLKESNLYVQK